MTSITRNDLIDAIDILNAAEALNHAIIMAAAGEGVTKSASSALMAVAFEISSKLTDVNTILEQIQEALS